MNKDHRRLGLGAAVLCLLLPWSSFGQEEESDLHDELEALKRGQEAIQRQIELKQEIEETQKGLRFQYLGDRFRAAQGRIRHRAQDT